MSVDVICEECGDVFTVTPSRAPKARFCSMDCRFDERGKVSITCKGCGGEFEVYPHRKESAKFCSRECRKSRVINTCEVCGSEYEVHKYREDETRFCSDECRWDWIDGEYVGEDSPRWKGGVGGYRGPDWEDIRSNVRERDEYTCQTCGSPQKRNKAIYNEKLSVHHVTPYRVNEDNSPSNLITLCTACHQRLENKTHRQ